MRLLTTLAALVATTFVCYIDSTVAMSDAIMANATDSESSGDSSGSDESPTTELPREKLCPEGEDEMSVEGVEGVFCVKEFVGCSADRAWGKCPGRQAGLPHGSYCGRVSTGVFGCKARMPYGNPPSAEDSGSGSA